MPELSNELLGGIVIVCGVLLVLTGIAEKLRGR